MRARVSVREREKGRVCVFYELGAAREAGSQVGFSGRSDIINLNVYQVSWKKTMPTRSHERKVGDKETTLKTRERKKGLDDRLLFTSHKKKSGDRYA